jgi:hypothetical protein
VCPKQAPQGLTPRCCPRVWGIGLGLVNTLNPGAFPFFIGGRIPWNSGRKMDFIVFLIASKWPCAMYKIVFFRF